MTESLPESEQKINWQPVKMFYAHLRRALYSKAKYDKIFKL